MTHYDQRMPFVKDIVTLQKLIADRIATLEETKEEVREKPDAAGGANIPTITGMIMAYSQALEMIRGYEHTDRLNRAIEGVLTTAQREEKPAYVSFTYRDTVWMVQIAAITRVRVSKPEKPDQELALEIRVTGEDNTLYIRGTEAEAALKVLPCIDLTALSAVAQEVTA